jgi:hypothetical protein
MTLGLTLGMTLARLRVEGMAAARLESPGVLWWRAQLRRRAAALERVSRPMRAAQLFALVTLLAVAAGFAISEVGLSDGRMRFDDALSALGQGGWNLGIVIPALGVLALLSGVAVYLASARE